MPPTISSGINAAMVVSDEATTGQSIPRVRRRSSYEARSLPVPGVKLRFPSGAAAVAHLARYPQIKLVKDNGDGSALYELRP